MKFAAAILIAFVLAVGYGSTPVEAAPDSTALTSSFLTQLLTGLRKLLTDALTGLFSGVNSLLLLVFRRLLFLACLILPAKTEIELVLLLPGLLALKNPTVSSVAAVVIKALNIPAATILLPLVPLPILATPVDLNFFLKLLVPYLNGDKISFGGILEAAATCLGTEYSLVLPEVK